MDLWTIFCVLFSLGMVLLEARPTIAVGCSNSLLVKTESGVVQGFQITTVNDRKVNVFQSIPYAEAPLGNLRFLDPFPVSKWEGVLDARVPIPRCVQMDPLDNFRIKGQEDCLYLSVYTPSKCHGNDILPVMVWFHGGAWYYGEGGMWGPRYLLDEGKVVLVTVNYRLGPFGFLATGDDISPGNQGLKDQVIALKWVQDNIKYFGADRNSVTIWGHSVGAASVQLHIVSPLSQGLFQRVIADSGSSFCYWAVSSNGREIGLKTAQLFDCPTNNSGEMIKCLRNVPAYELVTAEQALAAWYGPVTVFGPTIEPEVNAAFITKPVQEYFDANEAARVPIITGLTKNEGGLLTLPFFFNQSHIDEINSNWKQLGPVILGLEGVTNADLKVAKAWDFYMKGENLSWATRERFADMYGDRTFMECTLDGLLAYRRYSNLPVYAYFFSYQGRYSTIQALGGQPKDWGIVHTDQLIYLLNNTEYYATLEKEDPELEMSKLVTNLWTTFASTNNPNPKGISLDHSYGDGWSHETVFWLPVQDYDYGQIDFLNLTLKPSMITNPFGDRYRFWKELII